MKQFLRSLWYQLTNRDDQSHKLAEAILENTSCLVMALDAAGRIVHFNKVCQQITGYTFEEVKGQFPWDIFIVGDNSYSARATYKELQTSDTIPNFETTWISKTGGRRVISWSRSTIGNRKGQIQHIIGIGIDVTERRTAEKELQKSRDQLNIILEGVADSIIVIDADDHFVYVNRSALSLLGLPATAHTLAEKSLQDFKNFFEIYDEAGEPFAWERLPAYGVFKGEPESETVLQYLRVSDGTLRWILVQARPVKNNNNEVLLCVNIIKDITEQRRAATQLTKAREAALETSRLKSEFLANMSHEIRTPMNGVLGMVDFLRSTHLTHEQLLGIEAIGDSAKALLNIINDILDFSKIEAGKMVLSIEDFNPWDLINSTIHLLKYGSLDKNLSLKIDISPNLPKLLKGDQAKLRQVLNNIIGNAIKFTEKGSVLLKVTSVLNGTSQCHIRFEVIDTGIGIAESASQSIFEAFNQSDSSPTRRHGGTGLGLTISKKLVELMGGQLSFQSRLHSGSTFSFELPFEMSQKLSSAVAQVHSVQAPVFSLPGGRILVVEDHAVNQLVTLKMLRRLGCDADVASNGKEAMHVLQQRQYDLILMDCQMPELDGYETTKRIRSSAQYKFSSIPIIAVTASALPEHRLRCLAAGMNDHIAKPIDAHLLYNALVKWMPYNCPSPFDTQVKSRLQILMNEGHEDLFEELLNLFHSTTPLHLKTMKEAATARSSRDLERAAHALRSSCLNVGATSMAEVCRQIEERNKEGRVKVEVELVECERLAFEYIRFKNCIREKLGTQISDTLKIGS